MSIPLIMNTVSSCSNKFKINKTKNKNGKHEAVTSISVTFGATISFE